MPAARSPTSCADVARESCRQVSIFQRASLEAGEPVCVQTFIAQPPAKAFRVCVLRRLAGLDEFQPYPTFFAPNRQGSSTKFRFPLSTTMASGSPRSLAIRSSTRRTRKPPKEKSASIAGHSRVQLSTMVNIRITFPVLTQSLTKSIDPLIQLTCPPGFTTAPVQRIRRRCRILIAKPSLRHSR